MLLNITVLQYPESETFLCYREVSGVGVDCSAYETNNFDTETRTKRLTLTWDTAVHDLL